MLATARGEGTGTMNAERPAAKFVAKSPAGQGAVVRAFVAMGASNGDRCAGVGRQCARAGARSSVRRPVDGCPERLSRYYRGAVFSQPRPDARWCVMDAEPRGRRSSRPQWRRLSAKRGWSGAERTYGARASCVTVGGWNGQSSCGARVLRHSRQAAPPARAAPKPIRPRSTPPPHGAADACACAAIVVACQVHRGAPLPAVGTGSLHGHLRAGPDRAA